jgi:mediator of RNA polymerase II transcription subunit 22
MAHSRGLPQSKEALLKSYTTRLKDDVKSMLENFEGKYKKPYTHVERIKYGIRIQKIVQHIED